MHKKTLSVVYMQTGQMEYEGYFLQCCSHHVNTERFVKPRGIQKYAYSINKCSLCFLYVFYKQLAQSYKMLLSETNGSQNFEYT